MKFTLSWLKDHLETDASLDDISKTLTAIGLEVEQIVDPAAALKDFVVAEIKEAAPHPNASKLQVCTVYDGTDTRQIVCGAANARKGLKTVLAREGVYIPGSGITIKKTKIRDVESNGMLCSAEELGLADASEGILELPATAMLGAPAAGALGVDDPMIEIAITPNRADCLGVHGIARDLAAAGLGELKPLVLPAFAGGFPSPITVTTTTPNCPLFIGCYVRGVKNGPSPDWLQARLKAIGLRPISALVDITNYIAYEFGRPLHVFDAKKLRGNIIARSAQDDETLAALNEKTYRLRASMTVIADERGPLAIGGVIGGMESGCTEATTDVFVEAAYFNPENIAATGRALEILSDARYRFERGVDPDFVASGAELAVKMIQDLCGGEASEMVITGQEPEWKRSIDFAPEFVKHLGGVDVPRETSQRILTALGFRLETQGSGWRVHVPSWRRDVEGAADLVEEILRIYGYDNLVVTPLPKPAGISKPALNGTQKRMHIVKRALAARGMMEVCSYSFISKAQAEAFGGNNPALRVLNPISAELDTMRPSLLPNLLVAAKNNQFRGIASVNLFEAGVQFKGIALNEQQLAASGIRAGGIMHTSYPDAKFQLGTRECDAFDAKADALAALDALGVNTAGLTVTNNAPAWYHPGRSGSLTLGGKVVLGHFGEIHPAIAQDYEVAGRVSAFELFIEAIPQPRAKAKAKAALALSAYQAVARDFAFVVDEKVSAADITKALRGAEKQLIQDVLVFDVYSGKGMDAGKKSVAVQITLQAFDRTLSDAEITAVSDAVVKAATAFGGVLRT